MIRIVLIFIAVLSLIISSTTDNQAMQPGEICWKIDLGASIQNAPVIGKDGTIFISASHTLHALDSGGRKKWFFVADDTIMQPCLDADDNIYFTTPNKLYSLSSQGIQNWSYEGTCIRPPAVSSTGLVYVVTNSFPGRLMAFDCATGIPRWLWEVEEICGTPVADAQGVCYVGGWENWEPRLFAITPEMVRKWTFSTGGKVSARPAIAPDGTIIAPAIWTGDIWAITPEGNLKWNFKTNGKAEQFNPVIHHDGKISCGYIHYQSSPHDHFINYCVLYPNGDCYWSWNKGGYYTYPYAINQAADNNGIVYGGIGNEIFAINYPGQTMWARELDGKLAKKGAAVHTEGYVLIGTEAGWLYAIAASPRETSAIINLLIE